MRAFDSGRPLTCSDFGGWSLKSPEPKLGAPNGPWTRVHVHQCCRWDRSLGSFICLGLLAEAERAFRQVPQINSEMLSTCWSHDFHEIIFKLLYFLSMCQMERNCHLPVQHGHTESWCYGQSFSGLLIGWKHCRSACNMRWRSQPICRMGLSSS